MSEHLEHRIAQKDEEIEKLKEQVILFQDQNDKDTNFLRHTCKEIQNTKEEIKTLQQNLTLLQKTNPHKAEIERLKEQVTFLQRENTKEVERRRNAEKWAFGETWYAFQHEVHQNALDHGWYEDGPRNPGEQIALIHSELSEALEALRKGEDTPCDKDGLADIKAVEEELADVVIRIMDFSAYRGYMLAGAILKKHEFNKSRPHRHGGKKF